MNDHVLMLLVLYHLAESETATSREIAESLGFPGRIKYVSLVLTRCFRRGLVSRIPYRHGRSHGYVYRLTNRGAEWMLLKASSVKKDQAGTSYMKERVKERDIYRPKVVCAYTPKKSEVFEALKIVTSMVAVSKISELGQRDQSNQRLFTLLFLVRQSREIEAAECLFLMHLNEREKNSKLLEEYFKDYFETQNMMNRAFIELLCKR